MLSVQNLTNIVCNASTVTEALEYFKQERHDYFFPELVLITAKMTGEELLSAIRIASLRSGPDVQELISISTTFFY